MYRLPTAQEHFDPKVWEAATPPTPTRALATLPGATHARAVVIIMARISSSSAEDLPLWLPPEPPAAEGHGGGSANNENPISPLVDLLVRFPDFFKQNVLVHLGPHRLHLPRAGGGRVPGGGGCLRPAARGDETGGAGEDSVGGDAPAQGLHRDRRAAGMGKGERLPVGCAYV